MRTHIGFAAAVLLGCALTTAAVAQGAPPQIPTPANPYPANPVATDGTSLLTGRQVVATKGRRADPASTFYGLVTRGY